MRLAAGVQQLDAGVGDRPPIGGIPDRTAGLEVTIVGAPGKRHSQGGDQQARDSACHGDLRFRAKKVHP